MILPYFDYGDIIYNNMGYKEGLEKLQRLQNRCLKICKGYNVRLETKELHKITKIPLLEAKREAYVNNLTYDRLKRPDLVDDRDIRTRARVQAYKRSVKYAGALQLTNLPSE